MGLKILLMPNIPPFSESSSDIKLSRHRVNEWMEDWDVKDQFLKESTMNKVIKHFPSTNFNFHYIMYSLIVVNFNCQYL